MDPEAAAKQFEELRKDMAAAYRLLLAALARLPVPMNLPGLNEGPDFAALDLAWELAGTEPLPPRIVKLVREMITTWASAYEIMIIANGYGPAPWRLRAVADAVARIRDAAGSASRYLRADFEPARLTGDEIAAIAREAAPWGRTGPRRRRG